MNAAMISTPTDMRSFVGGHDHAVPHLVSFKEDFEPAIRHAVDTIFQDMQYISSDEPELVSSYLDGIAEPLQKLKRYRVSILAMSTRGTMKMENGATIPNWVRTYFLVIPTLGYFKTEGENKKFHHFDPACRSAMSDLNESVRSGKGLSTRLDALSIREEFENDAPWCEHCCLNEMIAISGTTTSVRMPDLRITCKVVERAIADAEALLQTGGPTSAVDRVHTALHGYLKTVCADAQIKLGKDPAITDLFSHIRQHHPKLKYIEVHQDSILKVLRALGKVVDALNPARNRGSMAHPNEELLDTPEATLFINAARTLLHYLDMKLSEGN